MRHDISMVGEVFRLRPVELRDAAFIVALRTDPRRAQFINATSPRLADQEAWLRGYFTRPGDYYFIIERLATGRPEGTIGLYDENRTEKCAEWGRWIVRAGSRAGIEGLLLVYRVAFERLALDTVYARTVADNQRALALHQAYGLQPFRTLPGFVSIGAARHDAIEHRLTRSMWPTCERALRAMAAEAAQQRPARAPRRHGRKSTRPT